MKALALISAVTCALALASTATAGVQTPIEQQLGKGVGATVVCSDTPNTGFAFHVIGGRAVVELWNVYCNGIQADLARQNLRPSATQGWHATTAASAIVTCFKRIGNENACLVGEPVAFAIAGDLVGNVMRKAGVTDTRYVTRMVRSVRALIAATS